MNHRRNAPVVPPVPPHPRNRQAEPRGLQMELMNLETRDVWLSASPVAPDFFRTLDVKPPWIKLGAAHGAMDGAFFRRSPGAEVDGPVEVREFGGHRFLRVARPAKPARRASGGAPMRLVVDKHHTVEFNAGAELRILWTTDGGRYVEASRGAGAERPDLMKLEPGMRLQAVRLARPWTIEIPAPATVYFFTTLDVFHGPVPEPPVT